MEEDIKTLEKIINRCEECKFATCEQCEINYIEVRAIKHLIKSYKLIFDNYKAEYERNERLCKQNRKLDEMLKHRIKYTNELEKDLFENTSNYVVPKSVIKEKIEKVNKRIENYREYTEQGIETDIEWVDNVADRQTIKVLEELLKE
jgi:hypothetical protein